MVGLSPQLPGDLNDRVHMALRRLFDGPPDEHYLEGLLVFQTTARERGLTAHEATNAVLAQGMAVLRQLYPDDAALLQARYYESLPIEVVRQKLSYAQSTVFARQLRAVERLVQIIRGLEAATWQSRVAHADSRIGAPATTDLVGIVKQVDELAAQLAAPGSPWIISIEGIGGIGKTALAGAVVRALARSLHFADFGWISAQPAILDIGGSVRAVAQPALSASALIEGLAQQLLPDVIGAIRTSADQVLYILNSRLKRDPYLIVIDNLETLADLEALIPTLRALANPSKFLLTSRRRLIDEPDIYLHCVPELHEAEALHLIRAAAHLHRLEEILCLSDEALRPVYRAVGGNPLALLLVIGQVHVRPLASVLADLHAARGLPVENLYTYIYRWAWDSLGEFDRRVLLAMPMVSAAGETEDYIADVCALPQAEVTAALARLIKLSLVYCSYANVQPGDQPGDQSRRYLIHSLTRTFLHEQVVHWA
jgi:hypothetical protein